MFAKKFHGTGAAVGSPSGDEIWGVPNQKEKPEKIIAQISGYIKQLNDMEYKLKDGDTVGLNAKFYIGRKSFANVEKHLKYHPETGEKLKPGTIVVEGDLLGCEKDVVVKSSDISSENIIYKKAKEENDYEKVSKNNAVVDSTKKTSSENVRVFTRTFTR